MDFGTYYWKETQAPPGYDLPANPFSNPITINADNAGTTLPVRTFRDPRATSRLVVHKVDATNQASLAGADFTLWLDEAPAGIGPEDTVAGTCTTGVLGRCHVEDLDFGTYYWEETAPPPGYDLPTPATSDPITIDATNAGTNQPLTTFADPRLLSRLAVHKVDATNGDDLDDAVFVLWLDEDGNAGPPTTADTAIGSCTTGPGGRCGRAGLDFGTYYWEETIPPTGYDLPADVFSDPDHHRRLQRRRNRRGQHLRRSSGVVGVVGGEAG